MEIILKRLFLVIVISVSTASFVFAGEDWRSRCAKYSELAETIMRKRQAGASMADLMNIAIKNKATQTLTENLIIDAYERPRYNTPKMQKRSIEKFRNRAYLQCVKANRSKQ